MEFFLEIARNHILDETRRARWSEVIPNVDDAIEQFIRRGWLRHASVAEHLEWRSLAELKNMLREAGVKVSGRKPELASRLADLLPPERAAVIVAEHELYAPTDLGAEMLARRENERLKQRQELEARVMNLLSQGDAHMACAVAGCEGMERRITLILGQDFLDAAVAQDVRARIGPAIAISELVPRQNPILPENERFALARSCRQSWDKPPLTVSPGASILSRCSLE
jgi:hypothetical protein